MSSPDPVLALSWIGTPSGGRINRGQPITVGFEACDNRGDGPVQCVATPLEEGVDFPSGGKIELFLSLMGGFGAADVKLALGDEIRGQSRNRLIVYRIGDARAAQFKIAEPRDELIV